MRYLFLIALLSVTGCVLEAESFPPEQEQVSPDQSPGKPAGDFVGHEEQGSCPSTVEIIKFPDGSLGYITIPGLCDMNYIDKGDPPPDQIINPQNKINPIQLETME